MFVNNYPAMKLDEYLVVSDIHIGISKDMYDRGVFVPLQSAAMAERLNKLKTITKTKKLVILGDVKHKVLYSMHEKFELENFLEALKFKTIIIVKGNHDGNIEKMIPGDMKNKIKVKKFHTVGKYLLTHGHRRIKTNRKTIVIGHNQPHIKIRDEIGAYYVEPVWVRGKLKGKLNGKKLVMMPAFNELCGATIINRDELLGPIAKQLDKEKAKIYLIDGTDLGFLGSFMERKKKR